MWPFRQQQRDLGDYSHELIPRRVGSYGGTRVTSRNVAVTNATVFGCLVLRADLVATMPINVFTTQGGIQKPMTPPPVLQVPSADYDIDEWIWASQFDLDSVGMFVGKILAKDGVGRPVMIEPIGIDRWKIESRSGVVKWIVDSKQVDRENLWVERQYPLSGTPIGLSPIASSAYSLGKWKDASDFAAVWFNNKAVPGGHLKNTARVLKRRQANAAKESFKASVSGGDVWVSGSDWTYEPLAAKASDSLFLEVTEATDRDVCKFYGVPGDMVDVVNKGKSITYANITQRNLQFLILKLGPAITKRERRFSNRMVSRPQFVKLDRKSLLEMDPATQMTMLGSAVINRIMAPSEARAAINLNPFTSEQIAEFEALFPAKAMPALPAVTPADVPVEDGGQDS